MMTLQNNHICKWLLSTIRRLLRRHLFLLLLTIWILIFLLRWKLMCLNLQPRLHMQEICYNYKYGKSIGNLCEDFCGPDGISSVSCHTFYTEKDQVFSGRWKNHSLIFKYSKQVTHLKESILHSEDQFTLLIRNNVKLRFNVSIDTVDAKRMSLIQYNQKGLSRYTEKENAWSLLQSNEYLALTLYEKYDIFPKLIGSCGTIYAVQKLNTVPGFWLSMTFYDSRDDWQRRVRISLMILDYLLLLEERLPEPLHLCDIRLNNFGVTDDFKRVMYLDLDSVHPASVANSFTANGATCVKHSDCDHFDCRSFCNLITFKCQYGVVNNNLQMVCERIFLGWVLSGKMVVPGLLLGPRTPRVLTELLEICANPESESGTPRAPAKKDIRNRLYDLLTHLV